MLDVAEKLAELPTNDVGEYFRGFRTEGLYNMRHDLPVQLLRLKSFRQKLAHLKQTVLSASKSFDDKYLLFWRSLKQDAPDIHSRLESVLEQIKELNFLRVAQNLTIASSNITKALQSSNFSILYESVRLLRRNVDIDSQLDEKGTKNIEKMTKQLLIEIETLLSNAFKDLLKKIRYPLEASIDLKIHEKTIHHIAVLLKCLSILDNGFINCVCDRLKILIALTAPMEKRFRYHFFTEQKTNDLSKPEWFFTQILTWISANLDLISSILLKIFEDKAERTEMLNQFVNSLVNLAQEKVRIMRQMVADDPELFSHLIDECVAFENELQDIAIPVRSGIVLGVLCEDIYLLKWLQLERESCIAGVEHVLCEEDCWNNRYHNFSDVDMQRVPECTDQFLLMIESVTERYRWIENLELQSQFLNIQIFMLDDFRLRLVHISQQVASPWQKPFIHILNSAWYIAHVLDEWNEVDIFIRIQALGKKAHFRGVFEDIASMYKHLWRQRAEDLTVAFYQHIYASLSRYEREHWYSWIVDKPSDLTSSFCPFLLEVRRLLRYVNNLISPDSATKLYEMLNEKVAEALLTMITALSLNGRGAAQILYDITNSLLPVLNSLYTQNSDNVALEALDEPKFVEVISYLKILSQSTGTAILLYEELKRTTDDMASSLLEPFDAATIDRSKALELLKHRSDLQLTSNEVIKF
ncbi:unnamed protein product [Thelazia callipaeda]|uniref:RAD50-interacting protein 1 n=1 Tax=Thelazia callipaeda TaxID=103827 RepID=A0A0N5CRJ8_THECL|nr:unnamed protein product [Thelazia callipaeda]